MGAVSRPAQGAASFFSVPYAAILLSHIYAYYLYKYTLAQAIYCTLCLFVLPTASDDDYNDDDDLQRDNNSKVMMAPGATSVRIYIILI